MQYISISKELDILFMLFKNLSANNISALSSFKDSVSIADIENILQAEH